MAKLLIGLGNSDVTLEATASEVRRFILAYEQSLLEGSSEIKRFVFRDNTESKLKTLVVDLTKVQWAMTEEPLSKREAVAA